MNTFTQFSSRSKSKYNLFHMWLVLTFCLVYIAKGNAQDCSTVMACNNRIQVSLSSACDEIIIPSMMLENMTYPASSYTVTTKKADGTVVPSNRVTRSHIGEILTVSVKLNGCTNSCWGSITVEDKLPPQVTFCPNLTVNCGVNTAPGSLQVPTAADACTTTTTVPTKDIEELFPCDAPFAKRITRNWIFKDAFGNTSTCTQIISVTRTKLSEIVMPRDYDTAENALSCNDVFKKLPNGAPHPDVTGYPTGIACPNIMHFYNDVVFDVCGASKKVLRQWTVLDWCTGEDSIHVQVIKILDKLPPICVSSSDYKIVEYTTSGKCTADYKVPAPNVINECSKWTYTVSYKLKDEFGNPFENPITTNVVKSINNDGTYFYTIKYLPCDTAWVVYDIVDDCGNASQCFNEIVIKDKESPTAVCDGFTVVTLEDLGFADISAEYIDNGSNDNCSIEKFEIKRLTNNCNKPEELNFGHHVHFCCADVSQTEYQKVVLRVTDKGGNYSECVANVKVQDKIPPKIVAPNDITIQCGVDYKNLTNTNGRAKSIDNCMATDTFTDSGSLVCGQGTITRTWKATDKFGNTATDIQLITLKDSDPFSEEDIKWPVDLEINGCSIADATPAILNSRPTYTNVDCADIVMSSKDEVFSIDGACLKILRTWRILNWCTANAQNPSYITHVQKILLKNNVAPKFITGCTSQTVTASSTECQAYVEHNVTANDDCTPANQIRYTWAFDRDNNGTTEETGSGSFVAKNYPVGTHKIIFKAIDLCDNEGMCMYTFTIKDAKAPTPICNSEVVWVLDEKGEAEVWAKDFDIKSEDLCTGKRLKFSFNEAGNQPGKKFTCADVPNGVSAIVPLKVYVLDTFNNAAFCEVKLNLQDSKNKNSCPDRGSLTAAISGRVSNKASVGFTNLELKLKNMVEDKSFKAMTSDNGAYNFTDVPYYFGYEVKPEKKDDVLNGITTLDLVLIQRHILDLKPIDNPHDLIAADINGDRKINASDLVLLRKTLLGIQTGFGAHDPWTFIPANHQFADPRQPFDAPRSQTIEELVTDKDKLDFVAIKIGDINNTAQYSALQATAQNRTAPLNITLIDQAYTAGNTFKVNLQVNEELEATGLQVAIDISKINAILKEIIVGGKTLGKENYTIEDGTLKLSYASENTFAIKSGANAITLTFEATGSGHTKEISLQHDAMTAEWYDADYSSREISLETRTTPEAGLTNTMQVSPNPWSENLIVKFNSASESKAQVKVLDNTGKLIYKTQVHTTEGTNHFTLTADKLENVPGIYFLQVENAGHINTSKIILIK
jgi:hypothetical protein